MTKNMFEDIKDACDQANPYFNGDKMLQEFGAWLQCRR
jgi:hypothetical protein